MILTPGRSRRKASISLFVLLLTCLIASPAQAVFTCEGNVEGVVIYPQGWILVQFRIDTGELRTWNICSTKENASVWMNIEECQRFLNQLNIAMANGADVTLYWVDSLPGHDGQPALDCYRIAQWGGTFWGPYLHAYILNTPDP